MRETRGYTGEILLVEDEPRLREMLTQSTREMGFKPSSVTSGEQALRALEKQSYPVVVLDLNLPGIGGLDLLKQIRDRWPTTQAIILTGFGDLDSAKRAIHLDVAEFLTKPCALGDLEVALYRAFQRRQPPTASESPPVQDESLNNEDEADDDLDELIERRSPAGESEGSPPVFSPSANDESLSLQNVERQTILTVLEKHRGNRADAAAELGISLRKLYYRLGEYQRQGWIS